MISQILFGCIFSYFIGSIPFSYIVAKKAKGIDIRIAGEGNVGARNVWHVIGKKYGALAAVLDVSKGFAAYWLGILLGLSFQWIWLCGFSVVIGHDFPLFLRGRGGKGAASAMGFLLAIQSLAIVISGILIGAIYFPFRNFHLAVGLGMSSIPIGWHIVFKRSWTEVAVLVSFLLFLGFKRLIDEPYMRRIKQESGW